MDKAILKKFAIESRQDLMEKIKNKINTFYVDEEFKNEQKGDLYILSNEKHIINLTNDEYKKRELLIKRIKELSLEQVIEEAAYTWFNRIIAIRYMEINDMLPLTRDNQSLGIRVLSSKDNTPDPEILKFTNLVNPDLDIDFKKEKYAELKDDNEKFKYVLLLICRKLGRVIPQVFDGVTDYIDILIPDNLLNDTGFITKVINEVPENNYNQVEIIGWLYQYYNQLEKDRLMNANEKYEKKDVPYVTQIFTPEWIVKYMVENTLGRFCLEHGINKKVKDNWHYYIDDEQVNFEKNIDLTNISFIDPCCGSGHILLYAFEIFYQIYIEQGYSKTIIPELILKNNLYGLDIDDRAGQLSVLSIVLKAREYDKEIFNKNIIQDLNIMSIQETNNINRTDLELLMNDEEKSKNINYIYDCFLDAKEIGSLIKIDKNINYKELLVEIDKLNQNLYDIFDLEKIEVINKKFKMIEKIALIMSKTMDIMVTNPPYIDIANIDNCSLHRYLNKEYKNSKKNLCTAFMECGFVTKNTMIGIINQNIWMFKPTYSNFRKDFMNNYTIYSMIHLGTRAFEELSGEKVDTVVTIMKRYTDDEKIGKFIRLVDYKTEEKEKEIFNKKNYYYKTIGDLKKNPQGTIAYWITEHDIYINTLNPLSMKAKCCSGMQTGDVSKYVRYWFEVDKLKNYWNKYMWGGNSWRWYGNYISVINWKNNGKEIKENSSSVIRNPEYYFKRGITWKRFCSTNINAVVLPNEFIFDQTQDSCFVFDDRDFNNILGLLNSCVSNYLISIVSSGLSVTSGSIEKIPLIETNSPNEIVNENIQLAKEDWDSFETSWDFKKHPLIIKYDKEKTYVNKFERDSNGVTSETACGSLELAYEIWKKKTSDNFNLLKKNEEEINKIFIDIYGLQNELTPEVEDKDVTIRKANKEREIKSLISYAVGCMFGRYSLDKDGLIYAGGEFDEFYKHYKEKDSGWAGASLSDYKYLKDGDKEIELSYSPDIDNIIPITDEAYFGDDIVERFKKFIKVVYGEETFNENMDFIAETLGKKGTETSEDTIRRYFLNDFFNDHVKIYQKRPIYWLFDSGKKNGFKALVYMHRYNENLIPKVRLDYLHRVQTTYEKLLSDVNYKLTTELSMSDKKAAQNRQADLMAKLNEIKEYDERIAHIANQRISIDLDDGVKENYEKFKDILAKIK